MKGIKEEYINVSCNEKLTTYFIEEDRKDEFLQDLKTLTNKEVRAKWDAYKPSQEAVDNYIKDRE